jgi:serine/threonine protein kinase
VKNFVDSQSTRTPALAGANMTPVLAGQWRLSGSKYLGAATKLSTTAQENTTHATTAQKMTPGRDVAHAITKSYAKLMEVPKSARSRQDASDRKPSGKTGSESAREPPRVRRSITSIIGSNYRMGAVLGQGAQATVHAAVHRATQEKVAVKIYDRKSLADDCRYRAVMKEISVLKRLSHPSVLRLLDSIEEGKRLYIVMNELPQGTLTGLLRKHNIKNIYENTTRSQQRVSAHCKELGAKKHLPDQVARRVLQDVARGLAHVHSVDIVHRDIKPENIMFDETGRAVICDFGLSAKCDETSTLRECCGTLPCMAPEILRCESGGGGGSYGKEIDVWALGVVLYIMLVGQIPFLAEDPKGMLFQIQKGRTLKSFPSHVSRSASELIKALLNPNINARLSPRQVTQDRWVLGLAEVEPVKVEKKVRKLSAKASTKPPSKPPAKPLTRPQVGRRASEDVPKAGGDVPAAVDEVGRDDVEDDELQFFCGISPELAAKEREKFKKASPTKPTACGTDPVYIAESWQHDGRLAELLLNRMEKTGTLPSGVSRAELHRAVRMGERNEMTATHYLWGYRAHRSSCENASPWLAAPESRRGTAAAPSPVEA